LASNGQGDAMTELTDNQIALLCDIGEFNPSRQTEEKKHDLEQLISRGYAEPTTGHPAYKLTAAGTRLLGERGAGLNEA
jgi:hypothetical protein